MYIICLLKNSKKDQQKWQLTITHVEIDRSIGHNISPAKLRDSIIQFLNIVVQLPG